MSSLPQPDVLPKLTKYEILEELGHGGMATVYRARDERLGREVAVKIIHRHLRESVEVAARFEAEARAVAKLRHPNIIEVYDVSEPTESEKYIVVELSRGTTLRRLLTELKQIPPEVAAALGILLASALAHAHAAGVVHRDIKPENVMIDTRDDVKLKLTDFGIAKILDMQGVTSTGQVLGSPAHMAPEQIEGGEVDARADVFGLGVLLYECMVGHLPFEGKNPAQVLRRVLEGSFAPAEREVPAVGGRWSKILSRALAKEAVDRFPSATDMLTALRDELDAVGASNPDDELRAFFGDPEGYRARHAAKLVGTLTKRGVEARKAGDLQGAADDFNRAFAYAPQDATLLKLIGRLRRGRATRRALGLGLSIALGSVLLGVLSYVISRSLRHPPAPVAVPTGLVEAIPSAPLALSSPVAVVPLPAPSASVSRPTERPPHRAEPAAQASPALAPREVSFVVVPKGALVSIDNGPAENLFMRTKKLAIGPHLFVAEVPAPSKCCEPLRLEDEIRADDGSGAAQQVSLSLKFRDAMLSAPESPAGSQLRCPIPRIAGPASQVFRVKMSTLEQDVSCDLDAPGLSTQRSSITLRAGEVTAVPWSQP